MTSVSTYETPFKRRINSKTNYKKRLALLRSNLPRLVVRKSNKKVLVQIIEYNVSGDKTIVSADSRELKKFGWTLNTRNTPSAYLAGLLCGLKAKEKKIVEVVLDIGLNSSVHGSVVFSVLKGAIDAGLKSKSSDVVFPVDERIKGKHLGEETVKQFEKVKAELSKKFGDRKGSEK